MEPSEGHELKKLVLSVTLHYKFYGTCTVYHTLTSETAFPTLYQHVLAVRKKEPICKTTTS